MNMPSPRSPKDALTAARSADLIVFMPDGSTVNRSRNLAGIRRYVSRNIVNRIVLTKRTTLGAYSIGALSIYFDNGAQYHAGFASYEVLERFVSNWRNVRGVSIERVEDNG